MLFRAYNLERGVWASEFDAFLFFFAYLTLAYSFSLVTTLLVEMPIQKLLKEFLTSHNVKREDFGGIE